MAKLERERPPPRVVSNCCIGYRIQNPPKIDSQLSAYFPVPTPKVSRANWLTPPFNYGFNPNGLTPGLPMIRAWVLEVRLLSTKTHKGLIGGFVLDKDGNAAIKRLMGTVRTLGPPRMVCTPGEASTLCIRR